MAKKDISTILTTGSLKQRALLIAEDIARNKFAKDRLLTDHEFNQLSDSFKKPNEIKLYNRYRRADRIVTNALLNLQGSMFETKMNYSNLRGYILTWHAIENAELLVNSVLHEIKDPKERKRIATSGAKGLDLLFSKTETDEEGYIDIKIDFEKETWIDKKGKVSKDKKRKTNEYSLWYVMNNVKKEAIKTATRFISWRQAILDYMEEEDFNIKTYKELIDTLTTQVYTPIVSWQKYQSEEEQFFSDIPHPRLDRIKSKYAITPNMKELEVDKLQYDWFKNNLLGDE